MAADGMITSSEFLIRSWMASEADTVFRVFFAYNDQGGQVDAEVDSDN